MQASQIYRLKFHDKNEYRCKVVNFTVATYRDYNQHCLQGNVWSYDSTFLFVGSVATTIGYGNVTPKTREEIVFSTNQKAPNAFHWPMRKQIKGKATLYSFLCYQYPDFCSISLFDHRSTR